MSTLGDALAKHKPRLLTEVEGELASGREFARLGPAERRALVQGLFEALVARVRVSDDPGLSRLLSTELVNERVPRAALLGLLVRVAREVRSVLFLEMTSRRVAAIASAGIDRAVAETLEELATALDPRPAPTVVTSLGPERRDPTILRNINEMLAAKAGEDLTASVIAVAVRAAEGARGTTMVAVKRRVHEVTQELARRAGAEVLATSAGLVAVYVPARVDDADAEEALSLALELVRQPELVAAGVGVARGRLCIEEGERREAFGEALLVAASLASTAKPGQVICSQAVHQRTRARYVLRAAPAEVHGFAVDPEQPKWADRWEEAAQLHEAAICGRDSELQALEEVLKKPGGARLVTVRGKAGIGKRRLLDEALARAGVPPERVLRGEPHPMAPAPYWPLVSLLRHALGLAEQEVTPGEVHDRLEALGRDDAEVARLRGFLPTLLALLCPEVEDKRFEELEPAAVRAEIAVALRALLEALAARSSQPLVVALDEAQDLDGPSAEALGAVTRGYAGQAGLVLVMTHRGALKLPQSLRELERTDVVLGRIDDAAVLELARHMLDDEPPSAVARLLSNRSEGSPLVVTTLLRYLVESGLLVRRGGEWRLTGALTPADVPRRASELWRRRIEQLPATHTALLKAAATVGDPVPWVTLELLAVHQGLAKDELQRAMSLLGELRFLQGAPGQELRFVHPLGREVAYRMQSADERRAAHRLAAIACEERYPNARTQLAGVLFRHLREAGDETAAREAAVQAVRRAASLHDHKGALALANAALTLADDDTHEARAARFELLLARERIHDARGRRAEQKDDIKELVRLAELLRDPARLGRALHRAARTNLLTGDVEKAKAAALKALEQLRAADPLDRSNALRTLALIRWHERDAAGARAALEEALSIYERLDHRRGIGFVYHSLGLFALDTGALEQACRHFEHALVVKRDTGDMHGEAAVRDALGQVASHLGDTEGAESSFQRALELRRGAGDLTGVAQTEVNLGEVVLKRDPLRAADLAREALRTTQKRRGRTDIEARLLLARALLAQRDRNTAGRIAALALRRAQGLKARLLEVQARLLLAEIHLSFGTSKRAAEAAKEAHVAGTAAHAAGAVRWRIEALTLLALAHAKTDAALARAAAEEALGLIEERPYIGLDVAVVTERCKKALASA